MAGRGLNKVMLLGYVGRDPELKYTGGGTAVANFSLATNESWKDSEGKTVERTEWHNIVAWRKLAEIVDQYVKKGRQIYLEGKLQTRSWDDEKSGQKRYKTEIVADQILLLGSGRDGSDDSQVSGEEVDTTTSSTRSASPAEKQDDDLPF